jgi:hypothetical protein
MERERYQIRVPNDASLLCASGVYLYPNAQRIFHHISAHFVARYHPPVPFYSSALPGFLPLIPFYSPLLISLRVVRTNPKLYTLLPL